MTAALACTVETEQTQALSFMNHAASALLWPEHIWIIPVESDVMSPTLRQGDYVAVDTLQTAVDEGVFLIADAGGERLRRLQPTLDGRVLLLNDNKAYDFKEECAKEEIVGLIVGRVIFAEKRIY